MGDSRNTEYSERELLLASWFLVYTDDDDDDDETRAACAEEREKSRTKYLDTLAPVTISRCPFTGADVRWGVDIHGLDGPFWDSQAPVRPPLPSDPPTLLGVMGAVQLTGDAADIPAFPFLAKPGPEVPFVLPSVLERPDVLAVVSAQLVGPHAGFAIAYFIEPGASRAGLAAIPEWGTDAADALAASYDYELGRWIEAGKLRWLEPYFPQNEVRNGLKGCPCVGQPGRREVTRIRDLDVWWPSERGDDP